MSNPKTQGDGKNGSYSSLPKCKSHFKSLVNKDVYFGCRMSGHKMRDCSLLATKGIYVYMVILVVLVRVLLVRIGFMVLILDRNMRVLQML